TFPIISLARERTVLHPATPLIMDPLSDAASVIAARKDILDLQQETNALTGVLTALKELLEGPNGSKLAVSRPLFDDLERCISTLANLKKVMKPRTTQKPMKIFGLRALKWPLKRAEVEASISDIGRYRSLFSLALQVDE
ncbi:hypothetical protein KXV38_008602, partial [Aspergillus fumigatus]